MGFLMLPPESPEIVAAFESLPGGPVALDPLTEETWQYHGSQMGPQEWEHHFRHRSHPSTGVRMIRVVVASPGWCPGPVALQAPGLDPSDGTSGLDELS